MILWTTPVYNESACTLIDSNDNVSVLMKPDEENFGFLIHDVGRLIRYRFDGRARTLGVTRPQSRLLFLLSRTPGETQAALADRMEVERITLCRMVDRLEEAGLAERRADPNDRRVWRIFLTPPGEKILEKLNAIGQTLHEELMAVLAPGEDEQFFKTLSKLRETLSKRAENMSAIA